MKTPVTLIIFNRPDRAERVFAQIRQAKPSKLLVIADGPRPGREDDKEKCAAARAIIDRVDWDCEVLKNYATENLGCGKRVSTGIDWVFENVEESIILEDDCVPHPTFFRYCEDLLEYYRDDRRVMHISGDNFYSDKYSRPDSYIFSRFALMWGWATWRRAWQQYYDFEMKLWPQLKQQNLLQNIFCDPHSVMTWTQILQDVADGKVDTWDYQWIMACFFQNGLAILPNVNLVTNIGFGADATHTFSADSTAVDDLQMSLAAEAIDFPLQHSNVMLPDTQIDSFMQDALYDYFPKFPKRVRLKLKQILAKKSGG
jgi:hypothetical protein